ncbi:MAG: carboxypeptidase-like regulatory domain-containing protein, partial [Pirellulales bacterium]
MNGDTANTVDLQPIDSTDANDTVTPLPLSEEPQATEPTDRNEVTSVALAADDTASVTSDDQPRPAMRKVTLRGTCHDENEQPLAGVRVRVLRFPSSVDSPELIAEAVTAADGKYEFTGLESAVDRSQLHGAGDLLVAANVKSHASAVWRVNSESESVEQTLTLHSEAGSLSGTVRDEAGRAVAGAAVYLPIAFSHPLPEIMSAVTDEEGRFSISDLHCWGPPASEDVQNRREFRETRCTFLIRHSDFGTVQAMHSGIPRTVDVTLHPPAVVTGRVIDAVTDQPAAGMIVSAQGVARRGWA